MQTSSFKIAGGKAQVIVFARHCVISLVSLTATIGFSSHIVQGHPLMPALSPDLTTKAVAVRELLLRSQPSGRLAELAEAETLEAGFGIAGTVFQFCQPRYQHVGRRRFIEVRISGAVDAQG